MHKSVSKAGDVRRDINKNNLDKDNEGQVRIDLINGGQLIYFVRVSRKIKNDSKDQEDTPKFRAKKSNSFNIQNKRQQMNETKDDLHKV